MTDRIVENADQIVDEMKRKARRRLVGAIVLALAAAILLPMLLEKEPRPLGDDVSVKIPPVDEGKFVNRLTGKSADNKALPKADEKVDSRAAPAKAEARSDEAVPAPAAAPAQAPSAPESTPAKKSVAEAEQRVLTAPAKQPPAKAEGDADAAAETKVESKPATTDAKPAAADEKPATSTVATAQPASPAAAPARVDGFVVQLAAFADDKGANSLANKLKRAGYAAFVEPVHTSRGTLWRVRVGGYGSKPEADAARVKLKGEGYSGIVAPAS
jgi:DedD protein